MKLILTLLLFVLFVACGVKGPPLPPENYRDTDEERIFLKEKSPDPSATPSRTNAKKKKSK